MLARHEARKIECRINLPHQMIFGDCVAKTKLVEQLTLVTLQTAHHGSTPPRFASTQRNQASRPFSIDFCNKIGPLLTCRETAPMSALWSSADWLPMRRRKSIALYAAIDTVSALAPRSTCSTVSSTLAFPIHRNNEGSRFALRR